MIENIKNRMNSIFEKELQFLKEEAYEFYTSNIWKNWTSEEIVKFQIFQKERLVPRGLFHQALTDILKRPVYTHEFIFNYDGLVNEYLGRKKKPSFDDILELIPQDKRVIIESKSNKKKNKPKRILKKIIKKLKIKN